MASSSERFTSRSFSAQSNPTTCVLSPEHLNQWFPEPQQRDYVSTLMRRGGLTRRRAEYFVRLWAYLVLKQLWAQGTPQAPIETLHPIHELIPCTHREAAELFYGQQDRGSDRAAGMMIDRLVALGLLEKHFDGQTLCLGVRDLPELAVAEMVATAAPVTLQPDAFNPRTDAIPVANLIIGHYAEIVKEVSVAAATRKTVQSLRRWASQYPTCMRVLRRTDNLNPVAISILFPVNSDSEENFFLAPSKSFFLTQENQVDAFSMAAPGDPSCTSVYVRTWIIDMAYMRAEHICEFLEDTQKTLIQMQTDFPNLCDLYSIVIHPVHEALRQALGFQKTYQDPQRSYYWIYLALDRFLCLNMQQTVASLTLNPNRLS